ncbi:bifunctional acetate--CoA ligase family protein/GNAT family N-acetyltransferase [Candidatus Parabeggiatoa sp. HSG14]|uniref:bifunctional acetate--CoA ligase family protein/GNAT family N-acetyltransferase n=1 Tax=Candidatus Parabeggiatoa sp. HSG14 TaxID=3055593 RepID=UPI0025A7E9B2|nr:bifunctional acetate--CoA ligase family protein/GNAT family N-acetyltransferase [Thiotrichales bacterium HSG14]
MSKHYLNPLFSPKSIAVFGASNTESSIGFFVFQNLLKSNYKGDLYPINPKYEKILDHVAYASIKEIGGQPIDLAIIVTPAKIVPDIIEACGEYGVKMAVIISAAFSAKQEKKVVTNAKRYGLRFIGTNSSGIMHPRMGLNAMFTVDCAKPGNLALVSQSGALCSAVLDWSCFSDVGFSTIVSMGTSADLDFGEILDYLVSDPQTQGILLYIENVHQARSFMSGLRAAARIKPVVVIKTGRHGNTLNAVMSHSGTKISHDDVFDVALQRAGVVRVSTFGQLFSAAETLAFRYKAQGNRLAIVTNGTGPSIMAVDRATDLGIPLAQLSQKTLASLNKEFSSTWSQNNPIDVIGDAPPEYYQKAVSICLQDDNVNGVVIILTPKAMSSPLETAKVIVEIAETSHKPLLACWMGGKEVEESHRLFVQARIPEFHTPEAAVDAFYYLSAYHQNQQFLLQTPASLGHLEKPDVEGARMIIENVLAQRRKVLTEMESKALLGAFRIPIINTAIAHNANEALVLAESMGFPIAMKVNSSDILKDVLHKSDVGGVKLNLQNARSIGEAFNSIIQQVQIKFPNARIDGVTIERMIRKPNGRELMVGMIRDPIFGPVITFGVGGTMIEVMDDIAVSLPPLNRYLANTMINKTRIAKLLDEFRQMPSVNRQALENVLLRVSEMVCELPWLQEIDINPLIIDENDAVAVDARIVIDYYTAVPDRYAFMAIHPYPTHLVTHWHLPDGTDITIRPIRPEDADSEKKFIHNLSDEAKYFRFMQTLPELTPMMLVRFTQIDYDREMALVVVTEQDKQEIEVGAARYSINPDGESCEFALVIADEWQHHGIAHRLMSCLIDTSRARGLKFMQGEVLTNNHNMLKLMNKLEFVAVVDAEDRSVTLVTKHL